MLRFTLNDRVVEIDQLVDTNQTLLYYLRESGLTGTKEGCNEGDCGACTVVVVEPGVGSDAGRGAHFRAVNACLMLLASVHGKRIYTVEGLAKAGQRHLVQDELVKTLGSQCGYCTPGVVMSMFAACYRDDLDEDWKVDDQMAGNLCRCTGYRPILDAARAVAGAAPDDAFRAALEAPLPPATPLTIAHGDQRFFVPTTLDGLFELLDAHPEARLVNGGTDLGLEVTKQHKVLACVVSLENIAALRALEVADGELVIGATARLSDVEAAARAQWPAIERMLRFFGARQIKNRGTVSGNLCNASPIGDMPPVLVAYGARVVLQSSRGQRAMSLEDFLVGYRKTALEPGEILASIVVPAPPPGALVRAYKVSKRQELDISTVSAGLYLELADDNTVTAARLAYGGMSAQPGARASATEAALVGRPWTQASVDAALPELDRDFTPIDDHRGSAWYRRRVAANLLRGFVLETTSGDTERLPYRPTGTVSIEVAG